MKAIREGIITEKLVPSAVYSLADVATQLGLQVSQTTVREALRDGNAELAAQKM